MEAVSLHRYGTDTRLNCRAVLQHTCQECGVFEIQVSCLVARCQSYNAALTAKRNNYNGHVIYRLALSVSNRSKMNFISGIFFHVHFNSGFILAVLKEIRSLHVQFQGSSIYGFYKMHARGLHFNLQSVLLAKT
jgi:gamma-glutamylcysteine synthetase